MTDRRVVASRDGVALGELLDGDRERLETHNDGAFDVDPDDRPHLVEVRPYRLAVLDHGTGELLGQVSWHATSWGRTRACAAWNVGQMLLPAARGRGVGNTVTLLLVEYLFATTEVDRIEAGTDLDNVPARRTLERAGFRAEGVIRGAQVRGGKRRDMVLYGLLRSDLDAV